MAEEIHASAQDKPEEVKLPGADLFDWLQMVMGCILAAVLLFNCFARLTQVDGELLLSIGRRRGFLVSGGEVDTERTANMLLDEFRAAKIGRITLDRIGAAAPEKEEHDAGNDT